MGIPRGKGREYALAKLTKAQRAVDQLRVMQWLESRNVKIPENCTQGELVLLAYAELGWTPPHHLRRTADRIDADINKVCRKVKKFKRKNGESVTFTVVDNGPKQIDIDRFYKSFEWRRVRYKALKRHGSICQCCGLSAQNSVVIHVDHIKPLRKFWHLRLDVNNLQVLCEICNHGKGSWDQTDWRAP